MYEKEVKEKTSQILPKVVGWRRHGMIQQERQNNIINILGGHSYAM